MERRSLVRLAMRRLQRLHQQAIEKWYMREFLDAFNRSTGGNIRPLYTFFDEWRPIPVGDGFVYHHVSGINFSPLIARFA